MNLHENTSAARRRLPLSMALTIALLMSLALAGPAAADHLACGTEITQNTTLDGDVGPCSGDGLTVAADDITLDLNGYTVYADNGDGDNAGIRLRNVYGVTVRNGIVSGFDAGVVIGRGSGNTIRQITASDNINDFAGPPCLLGDGIAVINSSDNTITQNKAVNNGPFGGITVIGDSDRNAITNNLARDNNIVSPGPSGCGNSRQDEGIRIEGPGAEENRVERNVVENGLLAGIGLHGTVCNLDPFSPPQPYNRGNIVTNNRVSGTAGTSIASGINVLRQGPAAVVCPAQETTIVGNTSTGNEADGIFVGSNSRGNTIDRNTVNDNGLSGIFLGGPLFANTFINEGPTTFDVVAPDRPVYTEGTDYMVMSGSGSGNVTATLTAIDLAIPAGDPVPNPNAADTSTSGCEQADYDAAGFEAGDVALIQRGTCTFVSKVALAIDNGASAVVMFNEGQDGRTSHEFGSVGPVAIPVLAAEYVVGIELKNLTQAGPVSVHVETNTINVRERVAPGASASLMGNRGTGNAEFDGEDANPDCEGNTWFRNWFGTVNQPCVAAGGTGAGDGPGKSGDAPGRQDGQGQENNRGHGNNA